MKFLFVVATALGALSICDVGADDSKMAFGDAQRRGANQQNEQHRPAWWVAAGELGLDFVRILPDALPSEQGDFQLSPSSPLSRRGISPARTRDDLPLPAGPVMASM